jgi:hypothetical protein
MRLTPRPPSEFNDDNIFVMGSKRTEVASVDVESGSGAVSGPAFIRLTGDTGSLTRPSMLSSRQLRPPRVGDEVTVDHVRKVPLQTAHGLFVGLARFPLPVHVGLSVG